MTTLIFGGAGFVGLSIAEHLLARGDRVTLVDRSMPPAAALDFLRGRGGRLEIASGDVRDVAFIRTQIVPDVRRIVWGAAITADAARDAGDPESVLGINLAALAPVLRASRDAGVGRVLNLSSVAAYGDAAFVDHPLTETDRCEPVVLYGLTKFASERLVARLAELWKLDALSVRLAAVFGPWERKTSERDTPSALFQTARCAARGEPALLSAAGNRDWVYARDVARAVVTLLDAERPRHRLYNIASGTSWTALAWAERWTRDAPALQARLARPGERVTVDLFSSRDRAPLSIARLSEEFGWQPQFAALEDSYRDYRRWQSDAAAYWQAASADLPR